MIFHIKNIFIRVICKSYAHIYKFQRDFANKVEIHIYKFSQQLDHISHGKLIFFYFFEISIIFFYFFLKLKNIRTVGKLWSNNGQTNYPRILVLLNNYFSYFNFGQTMVKLWSNPGQTNYSK